MKMGLKGIVCGGVDCIILAQVGTCDGSFGNMVKNVQFS
jgi:hypothetical protein